ncbi:hypothetical protein [Neobacillus niacini]|uniref:hypothetical protein n=1 Tax=Neobacillus niacini TaxID=86668 RepID=UPI00286B0794|nr:hypothetical protein [Neobacillus niacini]
MKRKARRLLREYGAGETPQAPKRRGGSPAHPRKAKRLERKSTDLLYSLYINVIIVNYRGELLNEIKGYRMLFDSLRRPIGSLFY